MAKKSKLPTESGAIAPPAPLIEGKTAPDSGQEQGLTPDAAALLAEVRALRAKVEAQERKAEKKQEKAIESEEQAELTKEELLGLEEKAGEATGYNCMCGAIIVKGQKNCGTCGGALEWQGIE